MVWCRELQLQVAVPSQARVCWGWEGWYPQCICTGKGLGVTHREKGTGGKR